MESYCTKFTMHFGHFKVLLKEIYIYYYMAEINATHWLVDYQGRRSNHSFSSNSHSWKHWTNKILGTNNMGQITNPC
jgi:hypothetical protein